jgi:xanthine dehydrogenase accessory factor
MMKGGSYNGWAVVEHARELTMRNEAFVLGTVVWRQSPTSGKEGYQIVVHADGSTFGWIGGACAQPILVREALAALADNKSKLLFIGGDDLAAEAREGMISVPMTCQSNGALQLHIQPMIPDPTVVVVGRSPMAQTLNDLVAALGWNAVLAEGAFPGDVPKGAAVVIATQGDGDEDLLLAALDAEPSYVGLVASSRRGDAVRAYLRDAGAPEDVVAAIRAPVGIDLGQTSHTEMAVSILADLVAARARGELVPSGGATPVAMPATAIDPVCGMEVTADESGRPYEYEGTTYYFCCPACRKSFSTNPEEYLRSVDADQE